MAENEGLAITHDGHPTRLKWHRLRKRFADPLFSPAVLADGLKRGASMEIDLRIRADGGFAVLHDDALEGETTGEGPVREASAADLRRLSMKPHGLPLTLSEDLAALLGDAHPDALLQFDMKDDLAGIGDAGLAHLAAHFADSGSRIIVSGGDNALILAIRERLPHLRRGIDPSERLAALLQAEGAKAAESGLLAEIDAGTAPDTVYLDWQLLLAANSAGLDLIAICHQHGLAVDAWTFNPKDREAGFGDADWAGFAALMRLRPDQVTTDEPLALERFWLERVDRIAAGA